MGHCALHSGDHETMSFLASSDEAFWRVVSGEQYKQLHTTYLYLSGTQALDWSKSKSKVESNSKLMQMMSEVCQFEARTQ